MTAAEETKPVACNYYGAAILWLTTGTGKRMPVDARPDRERGNVMVDTKHGRADVLGRGQAAGARADHRPLHLHHRLTCPHASKWARKGH